MIVIEQLAAKLQIQLAAKLRDALLNVSSLQLDILRVVETWRMYGSRPVS